MIAGSKVSVALSFTIAVLISGCTHYADFPELEEGKGILSADEQNAAYDDSQILPAAEMKKDITPETKEVKQQKQNKAVKQVAQSAEKQADLAKPDPVVHDEREVNYIVPSKRTPVVITDMDLIEMDANDEKSQKIKPASKTTTVLSTKKKQRVVNTKVVNANTEKAEAPSVFYLAETILFDNGSSTVSRIYFKTLQNIVKEAKAHKAKIVVQGFASSRTRNTDIITHKTTNLKVSVSRAENVAKVLQRYGMPKSSIITEGLSDSRPLYKEVMPEGERLNRRAEIYISY